MALVGEAAAFTFRWCSFSCENSMCVWRVTSTHAPAEGLAAPEAKAAEAVALLRRTLAPRLHGNASDTTSKRQARNASSGQQVRRAQAHASEALADHLDDADGSASSGDEGVKAEWTAAEAACDKRERKLELSSQGEIPAGLTWHDVVEVPGQKKHETLLMVGGRLNA